MINREPLMNVSERLWVSEYFLGITPSLDVLDFISNVKKELYVNIDNFSLRNSLPCVKLLSMTANSAYTSKLIAQLKETVSNHSSFELSLDSFVEDFSNENLSIALCSKDKVSALADSMFMKLHSDFNVKQTTPSIEIAADLSVEKLARAKQMVEQISLNKSFNVKSVTLFKHNMDGSLQAMHDFKLS